MKDRGFTTVDSRKMTKIFTLLATACYRASDQTMAIACATRFVDEMKTKSMARCVPINCNKLLLQVFVSNIEHSTH